MLPWKAIGISLPAMSLPAISLPEYFYNTKRTSIVFPWKAICICLPLAGVSLSPLCPGPQNGGGVESGQELFELKQQKLRFLVQP